MKWNSWKSFVVIALSVTLLSCKQEEMDDLAKAQKCLDEVPQTAASTAIACLRFVEKYNSQQANILKCSIYMTSGGLVESRMVAAYKAVDNESNNSREATFISMLALNQPNVIDGYQPALKADNFCQMTGVPGLQYISGIVKIGSFMASTIEGITAGIDFSDSAAVTAAVNDLVTKCNTNDPACPTDLTAIGASATVLSEGYCASDNADSEVCENINAAVVAANGDSAKVGEALMCYLGNKTYNVDTGACNP